MKPPKFIHEKSVNYLYKGHEISVSLPAEIIDYLSQAEIGDFTGESDDLALFEMVYPEWFEYVKTHMEAQLEIKRWQKRFFGDDFNFPKTDEIVDAGTNFRYSRPELT
jgi:hypothetical protein